jgi:hypothetical protein
MGCSGSRILDKDGRPVIIHKPNPERDKAIIRYRLIIDKIEAFAKSDEDIILSAPSNYESIRSYYDRYKELFEKQKISEDELYEGAQWYNIIVTFLPEYLDMYELFEDAFRGLYNSDNYYRKVKLIESFRNKLSELKNYKNIQKGIPIEGDDDRIEKALEFIQYDKRANDIEAISFILKEKQANNYKILSNIAQTLRNMTNVSSVALVINFEDEKINEIRIDDLGLIFDALSFNVKIKAFVLISAFHLIKISEKAFHALINMIKKNEFLTLLGLSKIDIDEKAYKQILKKCSMHKNIKALGFDFKGEFNENYFDIFTKTIKTSKNITIGCFYSGDNVQDNEYRQNQLDEIKEKYLSINTNIIIK